MLNTPAAIGAAGETIVGRELEVKGYAAKVNTALPGSTDIEATAPKSKLLVQVKAAEAPDIPADMTPDEVRNIKARAAKIGATAYQAKVAVNTNLKQVDPIDWKKL